VNAATVLGRPRATKGETSDDLPLPAKGLCVALPMMHQGEDP